MGRWIKEPRNNQNIEVNIFKTGAKSMGETVSVNNLKKSEIIKIEPD